MQYKTVEGFKFLHSANAFLSQIPLRITHNNKNLEYKTALDLLYPEVKEAEQSCYLIYLDNEEEPVCAGQYAGLFKDYWLREHKYIRRTKHNDDIESALKAGRKVSIWLSVSPYATLPDGRKLNISKEIEQIIIESVHPKWSSTDIRNDSLSGISVENICSMYKRSLPEIVTSLSKDFENLNLSDYLEKLSIRSEASWHETQNAKIAYLSRCRHFLSYVSSGVPPEEAANYVWNEFP